MNKTTDFILLRNCLIPVLAIIAILYIYPVQNAPAQDKNVIEWVGFDEGIAIAKKENKPILIDVYTDWCTWCKEMDKKVFSDKTVIEYISKYFVAVKFNAESNQIVTLKDRRLTQRELSYAMGITSYPTTLFLKPDGAPITRLPGYVPPETYRDVVEYIKVAGYDKMTFEEWQLQKIKEKL